MVDQTVGHNVKPILDQHLVFARNVDVGNWEQQTRQVDPMLP